MADGKDPFSTSFNDEFKIDEELFVDLTQVSVGPMISESLYSIVYEGFYKNMPVAIKIIQPDSSSNVSPERKVKFKREVVLLSKMKHENIVKFIGASVEPALIIITELMKGGTLQRFLWSKRPHRLDLKHSLSFALGISQAMEYLHSNGVLHRDLKPSNLLLTQDKKVVKLADFGLAREETTNEMTAEAGTYRWMAPEMFDKDPYNSGKKTYDRKVDVYSYSLILWELLTNSTPFKGRNNMMVAYAAAVNMRPSMDDIPKELRPLVESCWAVDPARRPEFKEISAFLSNFLGSMSAKRSTSTEGFASKMNEDEALVDREEISNTKSAKTCFRFLGCFSDPR